MTAIDRLPFSLIQKFQTINGFKPAFNSIESGPYAISTLDVIKLFCKIVSKKDMEVIIELYPDFSKNWLKEKMFYKANKDQFQNYLLNDGPIAAVKFLLIIHKSDEKIRIKREIKYAKLLIVLQQNLKQKQMQNENICIVQGNQSNYVLRGAKVNVYKKQYGIVTKIFKLIKK